MQLSLQDVQRVSQMRETAERRQARSGVLTSEGLLQETCLVQAFQVRGNSSGSPGVVILHRKLRDTLARKTPRGWDFQPRHRHLGVTEGLEGSPWHGQEHRWLENRVAKRGPSVEPGGTSASTFIPLKQACIVPSFLGDRTW